MSQQDNNWTADILTAGIGIAVGLATSLGMSRESAGLFEVTKAVLELLVIFVILHYVRSFVQKIPVIGEIFGPMFYGVQLLAAYVLGAGVAVNYFPG
ncbi:MAG TPA: hypothetical protein VJ843_05560 [Candidatus Saccharimonadales bacterium]|nr:hypothetical protein [Candidatus Saccharimonadales bacterium]